MSRHYDEEAYAPVGTPFDPLETEEDVHKAKVRKDKEHYVLDEQGRRRFHGAFTGGFSAGYFNTVGSKEGWAPSTFRSSRDSKAEFSGQKPEDFMDAEDLGAHGIAPRQVSTLPNFQQRGSETGTKRQNEFQASIIPGEAPLQNLIIPARTSVGARLLRSMGWREGQGVGPRVQRPSTTAGGEKVYRCSLPETGGHPGNEYLPEEVRGFAFAPRDMRLRQYEGKEDLHGIGYRGMEERAVLSGKETKKAVHGMRGEAFGVGALEDEDTEDNVYGEESMTSYDVTLMRDGDVEMERDFGCTGGVEDSWSLGSFKKAAKPPNKTKVYHAPEVPRDFVPIHRFSVLNIKSVGVAEHHQVTVSERSQLLADKPGSVFSLLSAADRDRLRKVAGTTVASNDTKTPPTAGHTHQPHPQAPPTTEHMLPPTSSPSVPVAPTPLAQKPSSLGDNSIESIKPYARNPLKQARYEAFLTGRRPHTDAESVRMTEWERQRERNEFARTSQVYQPLAVSLSSRFTREDDSKKKEESPEPDSVQAARANMFGVLTREVVEWHPHPVICKRFNIPDPYPNDGLVGTVTEKHKQSLSGTKQIQFLPVQKPGVTLGNQEPQAAAPETLTPGLTIVKESRAPAQHAVTMESGKGSTSNQTEPVYKDENESAERISDALGTGPTEQEEAKEEVRPPMDLFKAIFAESSSSESEAEANEDEEERPSSQLQKPAAIVSGYQKEEGRDEQRPRKTRWQDLSAVASRPLTTAADLHGSSAGKLAGTVSENAAAIDRETVPNGDQTEPMITAKEKQLFGPALPPGFDSGEAEEKEGEETEAVHTSRHKHKHHKSSSSSRKEKRRNHKESSNEEAHSHRRRKEKKKSKNKH